MKASSQKNMNVENKNNYEKISRENEEFRRSLQLAGKVQRGSLPEIGPIIEGYDTGALMIPSKEVGGDFYDFFLPRTFRKNPKRSEIGIAIADAMDKNVPAGYLIAMTHALFNAETFRGMKEKLKFQKEARCF
jgi:sigma-B regulation protein RsbU (phosphoserine phosphatase)